MGHAVYSSTHQGAFGCERTAIRRVPRARHLLDGNVRYWLQADLRLGCDLRLLCPLKRTSGRWSLYVGFWLLADGSTVSTIRPLLRGKRTFGPRASGMWPLANIRGGAAEGPVMTLSGPPPVMSSTSVAEPEAGSKATDVTSGRLPICQCDLVHLNNSAPWSCGPSSPSKGGVSLSSRSPASQERLQERMTRRDD